MRIDTPEFLIRARLDGETLELWVEEEWLIPSDAGYGRNFSEADLARALLIHDLTQDLGVNDEGVGVILHLLDQVHGLRRVLAHTLEAAAQGASR